MWWLWLAGLAKDLVTDVAVFFLGGARLHALELDDRDVRASN